MGHIHEKIDFTASLYIVFEGKVLLHQHKLHKTWLPPGGHIELSEDPTEAALREAKEETGLDVQLIGEEKIYNSPYASRDLILPRFLSRHSFDAERTHEHVDFGYLARSEGDDVRHEIEGMGIQWFSKEELESDAYDILEDVRAHALTALAEVR